MPITRIEIDFALPVELTTEQQVALDKLIGEICDANKPDGWCFWPAGMGSKPSFSKTDAMFLGKEVDPNAPESGEPTWDDSVYFVECAAREQYPEEIERDRLRAELKAQRAEERKAQWTARLAGWLHRRGCVRLSWMVADAYIYYQRNFKGAAPLEPRP